MVVALPRLTPLSVGAVPLSLHELVREADRIPCIACSVRTLYQLALFPSKAGLEGSFRSEPL